MLTIEGKTVVTTDWHFGIKNSQTSRLKILGKVVSELTKYIKTNKIQNLLFLGDMFHQRNNLSVQTINVAISCVDALAKQCHLYLILGNHDLFNKNSNDINSMNIFKNTKNVTIISKPTEVMINGDKCLFVPWLADLSQFRKSSYEMLFGHFDISVQYLIASYLEYNEQKNLTSEEMKAILSKDDLLIESGLDDLGFETENNIDTFVNHKKSSELIGDWIEIVKENGTIFSGHIHNRKEFISKNRRFIFVGSPYQQTLGEMDSEDGFYTLDENNKSEFHRLDKIPVHVDLHMSKIADDISSFDFSIVTGNIVHRIYDREIDRVLDAKITQKIIDHKPYEEITPEYDIKSTSSIDVENDSVDLIRKSKLEYLHNYIDNIDESVLKENQLEKDKLFSVMTDYYNMADEGGVR